MCVVGEGPHGQLPSLSVKDGQSWIWAGLSFLFPHVVTPMCKETSPSLNYGQSQSGNSICADSSHLPWTRVMFNKKSREDEETDICSRQNIDFGGTRKRETSCECTWKRNRSSIRSRQRGKQAAASSKNRTRSHIRTSIRMDVSICLRRPQVCENGAATAEVNAHIVAHVPTTSEPVSSSCGVSSPSTIYNIYYTSHGVLSPTLRPLQTAWHDVPGGQNRTQSFKKRVSPMFNRVQAAPGGWLFDLMDLAERPQ